MGAKVGFWRGLMYDLKFKFHAFKLYQQERKWKWFRFAWCILVTFGFLTIGHDALSADKPLEIFGIVLWKLYLVFSLIAAIGTAVDNYITTTKD